MVGLFGYKMNIQTFLKKSFYLLIGILKRIWVQGKVIDISFYSNCKIIWPQGQGFGY